MDAGPDIGTQGAIRSIFNLGRVQDTIRIPVQPTPRSEKDSEVNLSWRCFEELKSGNQLLLTVSGLEALVDAPWASVIIRYFPKLPGTEVASCRGHTLAGAFGSRTKLQFVPCGS